MTDLSDRSQPSQPSQPSQRSDRNDRSQLSQRLAGLSPAKRELLARRARERNLDLGVAPWRSPMPPIPGRPRVGAPPLSIDQERIFFIHSLNPSSPFYNIYTAVRLSGSLDPRWLGAALSEVVRRHEIFRTRFIFADGRPVQAVEPPFAATLAVADFRGLEEAAARAAADRAVTRLIKTPFALDRLPLFRLALLRVREDELLWVYAFHHIVTDWVSFHAFQRELVLLYRTLARGQPSPLPELALQYADYAVWQRRQLTGEALAEQLAYWREQLRAAPHVTELPLDHPRPALQRGDGRRRKLALEPRVTAAARQLARGQGVTHFMLFLAAFKGFIARLAGQSRVVVGSPMAVREHPDLEPLLGFFLNQLVLHTDLGGDPDFGEILRRVRVTTLGAFAHKEAPFGQIVEIVQPARDLSRMPLTQLTLLVLNPQHLDVPLLPGVEVLPYAFDGESSKFDVTLALWDRPGGFDGLMEYNSELFDAATVERFSGYFAALLESAVDDPGRPLSQLALLSAAERHQTLVEWNDGPAAAGAPPGRAALLHELIELQAARRPAAPAVSASGRVLTYGDLAARAGRLAAVLRAAGVGPDMVVGLLVRRSPEMVVGCLGILAAGAAYLPLDPSYPAERLRFLLADSGARRLVAEEAVLAEHVEIVSGLQVQTILLGAEEAEAATAGPAGNRPRRGPARPDPENLAYVLYTSGSTGRPKGVMVSHRAVVDLLHAMADRPGLGPRDRGLAVTTLSFDVSVVDLFLPLLAGGQVVVADEAATRDGRALALLLAEQRITWMQATPATWRLLLESRFAGGPHLRLGSAGEALPEELAARLLPRVGELWNLYGPTEATVYATAGRVTPGGPITLGRPLGRARIYVLDADLQPVPRGAIGEIYLAGPGLARGYLHRPALTAERFLPDPLGSAAGGRLYRVGDRGLQRSTGEVEFLGRVDQQVKLRGFRIELGEIESNLLGCPGVREAAVLLQREGVHPGADPELVAFVVPVAGIPWDEPAVRAALRRHLPEHMVPVRFVVLERLPRNPNGKVDRAALAPLDRPDTPHDAAEPRHELERRLLALWREVLGDPRLGVRDNFFHRGGHSVLAIRLLARIEEEMGFALPLSTIFTVPTVQRMSELFGSEAGISAVPPAVVPIQPSGHRSPFFCVAPVLGTVFPYFELALHLGSDQPFYGLQPPALTAEGPAPTGLEDLAAYSIDALQAVQPAGPYSLGGWSFGTLVAYEMARQLTAAGEEVRLVALFDAPAPVGAQRISLAQVARFFYAVVLRNLGPYLRDYFYLVSISGEAAGQGSRWRRFWRGLRSQGSLAALAKGAAIASIVPPESRLVMLHPPQIREMFRALRENVRTMARYEPAPYSGAVTLFRTGEDGQDPTLGWGSLARGGVEVKRIPGNHMTLLRSPHVEVVARALRESLETAEPRGPVGITVLPPPSDLR